MLLWPPPGPLKDLFLLGRTVFLFCYFLGGEFISLYFPHPRLNWEFGQQFPPWLRPCGDPLPWWTLGGSRMGCWARMADYPAPGDLRIVAYFLSCCRVRCSGAPGWRPGEEWPKNVSRAPFLIPVHPRMGARGCGGVVWPLRRPQHRAIIQRAGAVVTMHVTSDAQ